MVHTLAALRPDGRGPTDGEARLAAAVFAVRDGRVGAVALPWSDWLAARQLAALTAPVWAGSVWDTVRVGTLALGVATALLVWAVAHRLGCAAVPTALAVAVVGVTPVALDLHATPTAAAVGVPWLLLAALLCWRGRVLGIVAAAAAVLAALTAPLVGAVLLALAAHWAAERTLSGTLPAARGVAIAAALGGAAAGVAVASSGSGVLAGEAAPPIPTLAVVVGVACGLAAVAAGWRVRWVRPLLTPAVLVLAVVAVPGPGRAAAALTGLALIATLAAVVLDDAAARLPQRTRPVAWAAGAAAVAVALAAAVPAGRPAPPRPSSPVALLAWAQDQDSYGAVLHAGPLDRAELLAAGFPAERLRGLDDPVADVDVMLLTERSGAAAGPCAAGAQLATLPGWDGAPAAVCAARPTVGDPEPAERASRARFGTALAGNPGLQLDPAAAALLRRGDVDPRVMIVLTALSGAHTLAVADFPADVLAPAGTLRRQVLVSAVDGRPTGGDAPSSLRTWLDGQHPPYAPTVMRDEQGGLVVGYRDPSPTGLLPG